MIKSAISRVACIQMNSTEDVKQNLLQAQELISAAAEQEAKLIVLPENFALMGIDQADKIKYREAINDGPIQDLLSELAKQHHVWIVGGTIPISDPHNKEKAYASCIVYDDQGKQVTRYDKIHLFDVELRSTHEKYLESKTVQPGEKIIVIPTPFGILGLAVCYDIRFPEMFRLMLLQGVEIIVLPAAFTYTTGSLHWDILVRARAIENLAYVLAACQTGTHTNTRRTYGHSMVVNPWGEVQVCLPENPGFIISEIDLNFLKQIRQDFPALSHRKKI